MEWVYNAPTDEPTLYETDPAPETNSKTIHQLFSSSAAPVEEPVSEPEDEYYGDPDVIEERVSPVEAFQTFAGRTFAVPLPHFSPTIYAEASQNVVNPGKDAKQPSIFPARESREEKLKRIAAEIDALKHDFGIDENMEESSALYQLSSLRDNLDQIEQTMYKQPNTISPISSAFTPPSQSKLDDQPMQKTIQIISPDVSLLSSLETRLADMEKSVGICQPDTVCPIPLGQTLADIQTRLALVTDPTLPSRLKQDAQQIAQLLQEQLRSDGGQKILEAAQTLQGVQKCENLIRSVPYLVERLRSLRKTQDEAMQFSNTIEALTMQVNQIEQRSIRNAELIENVGKSLQTNLKIVEDNLQLLNEKLDAVREH